MKGRVEKVAKGVKLRHFDRPTDTRDDTAHEFATAGHAFTLTMNINYNRLLLENVLVAAL